MGCDIHLYVEKRVNGVWVTADEWSKTDCGFVHKEIYDGRNYDLFAILADVRNGREFAGCYTGEGFNPIADQRGFPADVCKEVKLEYIRWCGDGHSYSYFTVEELLEYDWTQKTTKSGWVDAVTFYKWNKFGKCRGDNGPESWCGGVGGVSVVKIGSDEMEQRLKDLELPTDHRAAEDVIRGKMRGVYCQISWQTQYSHACSVFWYDTIPKLLRVGKTEDVRIVFWFDN